MIFSRFSARLMPWQSMKKKTVKNSRSMGKKEHLKLEQETRIQGLQKTSNISNLLVPCLLNQPMKSVIAYYPVVKSLKPDSYKEMIMEQNFGAMLYYCYVWAPSFCIMRMIVYELRFQVEEQSEPGYELMESVSLKDCK